MFLEKKKKKEYVPRLRIFLNEERFNKNGTKLYSRIFFSSAFLPFPISFPSSFIYFSQRGTENSMASSVRILAENFAIVLSSIYPLR